MADREPVFGAGDAETSLDLVEASDPPQRLIGDEGVAALGILEEALTCAQQKASVPGLQFRSGASMCLYAC